MTTSQLIAIDGSEPSARAVDQAIADAANRKHIPHIYLVNVQPALPPNVTRFIDAETVGDFQRETGDQALASAKAKLAASELLFHRIFWLARRPEALLNLPRKSIAARSSWVPMVLAAWSVY